MSESLHIRPSEGPCEIHDWPDIGLAKRLVDAMRERHGKGGINACRECVMRARASLPATAGAFLRS